MFSTLDKNPAPFSDPIIDALEVLIPLQVLQDHIIHDPFAGEGTKLGQLCDKLSYQFTGTDLESWLGKDDRVAVGDSTDAATYPADPFAIVTSPTYNNGCGDHFEPNDKSKRLTYRVRAGHELHLNNTGRYSGRGGKKQEAEYWRITREVVKHWPDTALVNLKDSIRQNAVYPLTKLWTDLLEEEGYVVLEQRVQCPGWRYGTNANARLDYESILVARR